MATPDKTTGTDLLAAAADVARALGLHPDIVAGEGTHLNPGPDAVIRLGRDPHQATYAVAIKRALRPATLGGVLHQMQQLARPALLVTDYVTPQLADALKEHRIPFIDAAGNAYVEQPGVYIWVKGNKPPAPMLPPALGRAFQPTGLQVLFALLCDPDVINKPYRELARMAGVAHGTVGWVIPDLQQQGFVADLDGKRGTRRLFKRDRLLAQWVDAYVRQLRPRTLLGRYYVADQAGWREWDLAKTGALWGGEPAAALLTAYLRPGELTLYADKVPGQLAAQMKFMNAPGPGHALAVEVRRKFWDFPASGDRADLVPPILTYADLLATGDARCVETAAMVHDAHVARLVEQT